MTFMTKSHIAKLPLLSFAMHCTCVFPIENVAPAFGLHVTLGSWLELSTAMRSHHETSAVARPGSVVFVWFSGHNSNRGDS